MTSTKGTMAAGVVGLLAAAALLPAAGPAQATANTAPIGVDQVAGQLWLSVVHGNGAGTQAEGAALLCGPDVGTHPRAAEACRALEAVDGAFEVLPVTDVMCTKEYAPVTVQAMGNWGGRQVLFQRTFANACEMHASTDPVFDLGGV